MMSHGRPTERDSRRFLSCFILSVLALQTLAAVLPLHNWRLWPFTDYPMFSRAYFKGSPIEEFHVTAVHEDGAELPLADSNLVGGYIPFRDHFVPALIAAAQDPQARRIVRAYALYYQRSDPARFASHGRLRSFRFGKTSRRIDDGGMRDGPSFVYPELRVLEDP